MGICVSKQNVVIPEVYNPDIERDLAEVHKALEEEFKSMGFPTNITLRIANMEWYQLIKYRQIAIPSDVIFPNPNTKEVIEEACDFSQVDKFVIKKNSKSFLNKTPQQIANVLIKNFNDETLKVRALFRWLASLNLNKIDFDKLMEHQMRYLLYKLKNNKATYAGVFFYLCSSVKIKCDLVLGYAKSANYEIGENVDMKNINIWNIVKINGFWYLCNPLFASRAIIQAEKKYSLIQLFFKKKDHSTKLEYNYNEGYFLQNPEEFIYSHFPAFSKYQLLAREVTLQEFQDMAYLRPTFFQHKLGIISHPKCIVFAEQSRNEILIGTNKEFPVRFDGEIFISDQTVLDAHLAQQIQNETINPNLYVAAFQNRDKSLLIIRLRLPQTAKYKLRIRVSRDDIKNKKNNYQWCTDYIIEYKKRDNISVPPFPMTSLYELGPNYIARECNFTNMFPLLGMYTSPNKNYTEIHFNGDDNEYEFYVIITSMKHSSFSLRKYCISMFENGLGLIRFFFPSEGEYGINIFGQKRKIDYHCNCLCIKLVEKQPEEFFPPICSYIVKSEENANYTLVFPENEKSTIGKQRHFFKLKLRMEDNFQSYQECHKSIHFKMFKQISCQFRIELRWYDEKNDRHDLSMYSFFENSYEYVTFHINFPLPGMYKFLIEGKELNSTKQYELVYNCYFYAVEPDPNSFEFPIITDKWRISETHRIIQPFRKLYSNEKLLIQIEGFKADEMIACRMNDNEIFHLDFFNDIWECEIDTGDNFGDLIIKAKIYRNAIFFTEILIFKIFKNPIKKLNQPAIEDSEINTENEKIEEVNNSETIDNSKNEESSENDIVKDMKNIPTVQIETIENVSNTGEIGEIDWSLKMEEVIYISEFLPDEESDDGSDETPTINEDENERNREENGIDDEKEEKEKPQQHNAEEEVAKKALNLQNAFKEKDYKKLKVAIDKASVKPINPLLLKDLSKANELKANLEKIRGLQKRILKLDAKCIAELNQYNQPPTVVHLVIKSTLLILSIGEVQTDEWKECRVFIKYTCSNSILKKIKALKILNVHPGIILRAQEIIDELNMKEVMEASAGAAAFYLWCKGNIDIYKKIKKDEIGKSQPANKKSQKNIFSSA
ncbi:DgyrCDS14906 [Dimorphilus gyrociliatus]|uniref:DgyrCDS14906 n=1 Tax=Dimorphilus gyrociliatus TaxID=2664684 RepID=A0A7I8WFM8_9ANNE|nr:DgyrCDS14906 [Dimorphilus gyrociliatus]